MEEHRGSKGEHGESTAGAKGSTKGAEGSTGEKQGVWLPILGRGRSTEEPELAAWDPATAAPIAFSSTA